MISNESQGKLDFLKNGIAQVAILVKDIDKAVESYWKLFGIGPWQLYTYGKPLVKHMTYRGKEADHKMKLAFAQIGSLAIELIEAVRGESIYSDFVREHGYGVHHFGVQVDNADEKIAQAASLGFQMIQDGSGFGKAGDGHYAYLDTEGEIGVTLELRELPTERVPPEKVYPPGLQTDPSHG